MDDRKDIALFVAGEFTGDDGFGLVGLPVAGTAIRAPYMRFKKGNYLLGQEESLVPLGTAVIALQATEGWVRLVRDEPPRKIPREAGQPFPMRTQLGDTDQSKWALFDGKPSDPWQMATELALIEQATGQWMIFTTTSATGRGAVADLCRLITYQRRQRGDNAKPVVEIGTGMITLRFGPIAIPKFKIIDWIQIEAPPVAADQTEVLEKRSTIAGDAKTTGPKRSRKKPEVPWNEDLDDRNPY
jgi:hypothetical protein